MAVERVVGAARLGSGEVVRVTVGDTPVCVARTVDGRLFAIRDTCSHRNVSLSQGRLRGAAIVCPLHEAVFDLATGRPTRRPATEPVPTYHVTEDGDDLLITLAAQPDSARRPDVGVPGDRTLLAKIRDCWPLAIISRRTGKRQIGQRL
jgi:3-phenylpropionate/trans-cinnamate dioxygenase ferredoxin subunit